MGTRPSRPQVFLAAAIALASCVTAGEARIKSPNLRELTGNSQLIAFVTVESTGAKQVSVKMDKVLIGHFIGSGFQAASSTRGSHEDHHAHIQIGHSAILFILKTTEPWHIGYPREMLMQIIPETRGMYRERLRFRPRPS